MRKEELQIRDYTRPDSITNETRASMIHLIESISEMRGYKVDTLFMSVSILDKYLATEDPSRRVSCLGSVAICCLLIAAKLEEPVCPSFERMCKLLDRLQIVKI